MNVVHEQVKHLKFGIGAVVEQAENIIEVKFGNEIGVKKFIYPAAFESFLQLCDPCSQSKLNDELLELRRQTEARRKVSEDEIKQHLEITRQAQVKQRRTEMKKGNSAKNKFVKNSDVPEAEERDDSEQDYDSET